MDGNERGDRTDIEYWIDAGDEYHRPGTANSAAPVSGAGWCACRMTRVRRHPRAWSRPQKPLGQARREASSLGIRHRYRAVAGRYPATGDMSTHCSHPACGACRRQARAKWATMAPLALREFAMPVMLQSFASSDVALRSCDRVERRTLPIPRGRA